MLDRPALSKGEMAVARTLWDIGPATVREVFDSLPKNLRMNFSTVQTYLRRLESKSHANSRLDRRIRVYSARSKPYTVIRDTMNEIVDRLFAGESLPLVRHLIEERGIDEEGLAELRELIDRLEKGAKK